MVKPTAVTGPGPSPAPGHHAVAAPHHLPPLVAPVSGPGLASAPASGTGLAPGPASGTGLAPGPASGAGLGPLSNVLRQSSLIGSVFGGGGPSHGSPPPGHAAEPSSVLSSPLVPAPGSGPGSAPGSRQSSLARGMSQALSGLRKPRKESLTVIKETTIFRPTIWMDGEVKRYADQVTQSNSQSNFHIKISYNPLSLCLSPWLFLFLSPPLCLSSDHTIHNHP